MTRNRDIAEILSVTEAANDTNAALSSGGGGGGGIDSAAIGYELNVFRINQQNISVNHTIDSADNAMSAGPVTVDSGVTLTVNGYWSVV